MNGTTFRKKYLLGLLVSPVTFYPFLIGATIFLGGVATGFPFAVFGGVVAILAGAGIFVQRLLIGSTKHAEAAWEEIQKEIEEARERLLDDLAEKLLTDDDARTEHLLGDLRLLQKTFHGGKLTNSLNTVSSYDITSGVDELFRACITLLEKSFSLWETAHRITTKIAREAMLQEREEVLGKVRISIEDLGALISAVNALEMGHGETSQLERIRKELVTNLEVARRVDERMRNLCQNDLETERKE